ncbi:MAG: GTP-binding protein [Promethearchaeota archaeon]
MAHLKFKIVVTGDKAVGKTSLIRRYCTGEFKPDVKSTIGVDFMLKKLNLDSGECTMTLWDFAGEEKFRKLLPSYMGGTSGALLVFDLTNPRTFADLPAWMEILRSHGDDVVVVLVGNKVDLVQDSGDLLDVDLLAGAQFPVDGDQPRTPRAFLEAYGIPIFLETSAKDGTNVEDAFATLGTKIADRSLVRCPHCGEPVPKQVLICYSCGGKMKP